jgi:AbrB family looped-hinge helix DNA binding protein
MKNEDVTQNDDTGGVEVVATENGRLTIPAQLRRTAGIEPGQTLLVYVEDGRVVIESREQLAQRIRRDVAASWQGPEAPSVTEELIAERRAEAARESGEDIR